MLKHYLVLSLKVLLRRKFFTFISIFGISFTLLVLMVVAALFDHSFGPGKPETRQDLMLGVRNASMRGPGNNGRNGSPGFGLFAKYAQDLPGVAALTVFSSPGEQVTLYVNGARLTRAFQHTDAAYWRIFDFDFIEGAAYTEDDVSQARPVAVINRNTRTRLFGEGAALGRSIGVGDLTLRVVGVVEDVPVLRMEPFSDIWVPHTTRTSHTYRDELMGGFWAVALAESAGALPAIREEFNARMTRVEFDDPREWTSIVAPFETAIEYFARNSPFGDRTDPDGQAALLAAFLTTIGVLFMALPTVNLININISRIMERASEVGVRKAFGASSRTLVGQFVVENVLLTLVGGLVGLGLSAAVLAAINRSGAIPYAQLGINARVFAYGMLMAVAFGLISGVYPAWRMARLHPVDALKGGAAR